MTLLNERDGGIVARHVARAERPWARLIGLLSRAEVAADEGLWFANCAAVHTIGMRATIDLYFLDEADRVVKIERRIRPGRLAITCSGARTVVELGAAVDDRNVAIGDRLVLREEATPAA